MRRIASTICLSGVIGLLSNTAAFGAQQTNEAQFIVHLKKATVPVKSLSVTPPRQLTTSEIKTMSAKPASIGSTLEQIRKLFSICSWNAHKECYLYFDSTGLHRLDQPLLKSGTALKGSGNNASPAPIASLTPDPSDASDQTDYQGQINSAQQLLETLQSTNASPQPCSSGLPAGFCDALASPQPLKLTLTSSKTFPITIPFAQAAGQLAFQASITPPGLAFPDLNMPSTSLANVDANLTFTPPGDLASILPSLLKPPKAGSNPAPAPTPSAISLADASVSVVRPTASPSAAPTPYVEAKATFYGNQTIFDQVIGFNDSLPPRLQSQSTSTNLCPGEQDKPLLVAFSLGVPGINLILSMTCPMIAGYQINDTWLSNQVSVVGAPKFAVGIIGDAEVTGVVGSLLSGGGEAELNVANGEMRAYALSYAVNDTYGSAKHALVTGTYLFGHYEIGGGDVFATVTFSGYTVYLRLIHVAPFSVKNFGQGSFTVYNVDQPGGAAP